MTLPALAEAARATLDVFARGPDVVYQAAMFDGRLVG
jgi:hypothetical protein